MHVTVLFGVKQPAFEVVLFQTIFVNTLQFSTKMQQMFLSIINDQHPGRPQIPFKTPPHADFL